MPPQKEYSPADVLKVLDSEDFKKAPPELQLEVRQQLGLVTPRHRPIPEPAPEPSAFDWLIGRGKQYEHKGLIETLGRSMEATAAQREKEDAADPTRTYTGRFERQLAPRLMSGIAKTYTGMTSPSNVGLGIAATIPQLRPFIGAYGLVTSGKDLLKNKQPNESDADYLGRVLNAAAGVTGSIALGKAGRGGQRGEMERRVRKATAASGAAEGQPAAFRATLPDLAETIHTKGMQVETVADIAKVVEATNQRFNTQMALAEQPFAGDRLVASRAVNELNNAAAEEQLAGNREGARLLRAKAIEYSRPFTLREIGARMRRFNKLYYKYSGKTSLEATSAQSRGEALEVDILRKALRDTYVDYLESKYPGAGFRDMRMRQQAVLELRDHLGEFNKQTREFGPGHVRKLESDQAKFKEGFGTEGLGGVASEHGVRAYIRLPRFLKRGPETKANIRARQAFEEGLGKGEIPRRSLKPLTPRTPPAGPGRPAGGAGGPQGGPGAPTKPGTPPANRPGQRPTPPPEPQEVIDFHRTHRQPDLKAQLKVAQAAGDAEWAQRVQNQIEISEKLVKDAREKLAGGKREESKSTVTTLARPTAHTPAEPHPDIHITDKGGGVRVMPNNYGGADLHFSANLAKRVPKTVEGLSQLFPDLASQIDTFGSSVTQSSRLMRGWTMSHYNFDPGEYSVRLSFKTPEAAQQAKAILEGVK
jgi:hypothetical protein